MSRQNKVNPGMYTQRGRLTQDDAARELRKQSVVGSSHTWQPVNTKRRPRLAAVSAARETDTSGDYDKMAETRPQAETRPPSGGTRNVTTAKAAPSSVKAKAAKAKKVTIRKSTTATAKAKTGRAKTGRAKTGKAKTGKAKTTAVKRTKTKRTRTAVLARNVSGGRATPRPSTKRRKT